MSIKYELPPVVTLLMSEDFSLEDRVLARKKLKGMVRDLRDQASLEVSELESSPLKKSNEAPKMRAFLTGGLDLFGGHGACQMLSCRLNYVDQVARSIALLSDEVWLYDRFSERALFEGRVTNAKLDAMLDDIYVLQKIKPLVQAGVVHFQSPWAALCSSCHDEFEARLAVLTSELCEEFHANFTFTQDAEGPLVFNTGTMYDPQIYFHVSPRSDGSYVDFSELVSQAIYRCIRTAIWAAHDAAQVEAAVFSNSKIGLSGILREEGRFPGSENLQALEARRAGSLPWVSGLSIEQTLQLREEASSALPRLREFLGRHLGMSLKGERGTAEADYVGELREQAAEVRAELLALKAGGSSFMRNALGIMSLSVFAYGFVRETMDATVGLFQLLTTLGLLHQLNSPDSQHRAQLESRPGYVLVKAQEILQHADS